jgi:hypothetical protein
MLFLVGTICQSISKIFLINLHSNQQLKITARNRALDDFSYDFLILCV